MSTRTRKQRPTSAPAPTQAPQGATKSQGSNLFGKQRLLFFFFPPARPAGRYSMQQLATKLTCFLSCCSMATAASPHALPFKQPLAPGGAPPPRYSAASQRAGSLRPGAAAGDDEGPPWTECDGEGRRVRQRPPTTPPGNTSWPASSASVTGGTPTPTSGKQREAKGSSGKPRESGAEGRLFPERRTDLYMRF